MSVEPSIIPADEEERLAAVRRYDVLDTPPDGAFERVTQLAARHFGVPISIVSIVDTDRIWFKSHHGLDGVEEIPREPGLCASAILHDEPWVLENAAADPRALANALVAGEFGLRFYAGAPLRTHDGFNLGTICVIDREPREVSDEERETLRDLAAIVMDELELRLRARDAVNHEQALRVQAERTARALQASLLPPVLPDVPGADVAALYEPAAEDDVGGDFYDVFPLDGDAWAVVVGDVSGKGPPAAAVTALVRHTIRTAALTASDPGDVLATANRAMFLGHGAEPLEHHCTAHLAFLHPRAQGGFRARSATAGHPPAPMLRAATGRFELSAARGLPLGWDLAARYGTAERDLSAGDVLVAYTDGLSEARRDGRFLGEDAVREAMLAGAAEGAAAVVAGLEAALAGAHVTDDAAAIVVKAL